MDPGEWQTDKHGRRYRTIGGGWMIEYERLINGVPESIFFASRKAEREKIKTNTESENK